LKVAENKELKSHESSFLGSLFASFKRNDLPIYEIVPYKRATKEGYLVDTEDQYQAFLKVRTTDLVSMNPSDLNQVIQQLTNLNRIYTEPIKILALTYSTETIEQQVFWKGRITKYRKMIARNPPDVKRYETMLRIATDNFRRVSWVEDNLSELTFFFVVYGKNLKDIGIKVQTVTRLGGKQLGLRPINKDKAEEIVFRLTNMNTDL